MLFAETLVEDSIEHAVCPLSLFSRKLVAAIRMFDLQVSRAVEKPINRPGARDDLVNAGAIEIAVVQRRIDKERAGGEGPDEFMKVERYFIQPCSVIKQRRHVSLAGPSLDVAALVIQK